MRSQVHWCEWCESALYSAIIAGAPVRSLGRGRQVIVTTPSAKADGFSVVAKPSALTTASQATPSPEGSVRARALDWLPGLCCSRTPGGVTAALTGEHRTEPKLPSTRDTSYPLAFPAEPPKHTVRGVVLSCRTTKAWVGQATRASRRTSQRDPYSPVA
jgi:hypothetical protein